MSVCRITDGRTDLVLCTIAQNVQPAQNAYSICSKTTGSDTPENKFMPWNTANTILLRTIDALAEMCIRSESSFGSSIRKAISSASAASRNSAASLIENDGNPYTAHCKTGITNSVTAEQLW